MNMENSWGSLPSAVAEARSMVGLVQFLGADAVRSLISITDKEKTELREWARQEPLLRERIEDCIRFRERVLVLFEKLLDRQETEKESSVIPDLLHFSNSRPMFSRSHIQN